MNLSETRTREVVDQEAVDRERGNKESLISELEHAGARFHANDRQVTCPFHEDKTPSASVYEHAGIWLFKCFKCHGDGEAMDIWAVRARMVQKDRVDVLPRMHATAATGKKGSQGESREAWKPAGLSIAEAPTLTPVPPSEVRGERQLKSSVYYLDTIDGIRVGAEVRWEFQRSDGTSGKKPGRWSLRRHEQTGVIAWQPWQAEKPFPVFGIVRACAEPRSVVLVVEGPKKAGAVQPLLPQGWVAVSWIGGADGVADHGWAALRGRHAVLWPDADDKGRAAMAKLANILSQHRCDVRLVDLEKATQLNGKPIPEGWDVVDAIADGWDTDRLARLLGARSSNEPMCTGDLLEKAEPMRAPVIHGLLRETEVMNLVAPPKSHKSWLVLDLALSVAMGKSWLGMHCELGDVLIVDNELHQPTFAHRLREVAAARGATRDHLQRIRLWSLRGTLMDINSFAEAIQKHVAETKPRLLILDALYRFYPAGHNENDNALATGLYNTLDSIAARVGAAIAIVHHASKGNQAEKGVTDTGSGAGAMSRAADTHAVLRAHEEADAAVLEAVCRSWPPRTPIGIRWAHPRWTVDEALDPTALAGKLTKKNRPEAPALGVEQFAHRYIGPEPKTNDAIIGAAESEGWAVGKAKRMIAMALEAGHAHRRQRAGTGRPALIATEPGPSDADGLSERVLAFLADHPDAKVSEVEAATGASRTYVYDLKRRQAIGAQA